MVWHPGVSVNTATKTWNYNAKYRAGHSLLVPPTRSHIPNSKRATMLNGPTESTRPESRAIINANIGRVAAVVGEDLARKLIEPDRGVRPRGPATVGAEVHASAAG